MKVEKLDPGTIAAINLIALSDEYMGALYPAESNHLESVQALAEENVMFLGGYVDGQLAACGAVKTLFDEREQVAYGEIKRVFVIEKFRGKGLSKYIMHALEQHLFEHNIPIARLESGILQPEALGLYARLGYVKRGIFGDYQEDPLSVFMEKKLAESQAENA